jgi:hypothetical protein
MNNVVCTREQKVTCTIFCLLWAAARSRAWIASARSNAGVVSCNTTRDMEVCVSLFGLFSCRVGRGLATDRSTLQSVFPTVFTIKNLENRTRQNKRVSSYYWPPLWSSGQSSWLEIRRPGFDSRHYHKKSSGSGTGFTQPREYNWGATW